MPAPWWKTDYFEIRYENQNNNQRYFYQLNGEGIRYELVSFVRAIENKNNKIGNIDKDTTCEISKIMHSYISCENLKKI